MSEVAEVYQYIEQEKWEEAEKKIEYLEGKYGEIPKILHASSYFRMLKP